MAKMVGYACSIRYLWMKKAVELLKEGLAESEYKDKMNEYLSFEIDSPTRLRKTREILMNIWYYDKEENITAARNVALDLIDKFPDDEKAIYYCMVCITYPVFADVCRIMGKLFEFQDEVTNPTLKTKLFDEWGERGTLDATTRRITLTLKEMGILSDNVKAKYTLNKESIRSPKVVDFMLWIYMMIGSSTYYSLIELGDVSMLFPFSYKVKKEEIIQDDKFTISNFGGQMTIGLKG